MGTWAVGNIPTLLSIFGSMMVILWRIAKKDQQFRDLVDRVGEFEDGYLSQNEFKLYRETQQQATKELLSHFNSRLDHMDKHLLRIYDFWKRNGFEGHVVFEPYGESVK